jgi:CRP/FNR family transcriptional regulator, cyclic AMP receptor protein
MSSVPEIVKFFTTLPLFRGICADQLEQLASMVRSFEFGPGMTLFRQGDESDGMYFIRSGSVEIRARVPGDAAVTLRLSGPGDLLGEAALLDRGVRTATAFTLETTAGYWLGCRHFETLRLDRTPASLLIMQRVINNTCFSVRRSFELIAELHREATLLPRSPPTVTVDFCEAEATGIPFGSLPFLSLLSSEELQDFLRAGRLLDAKRGSLVYCQGSPSEEVYLVLRGALRSMLQHGQARFQIAVHPPGSIVGVLSALDGQPNATSCETCEISRVLALKASTIRMLQEAQTPLAWHLTEHIQKGLARVLRQCTEHVFRLELERQLHAGEKGAGNV